MLLKLVPDIEEEQAALVEEISAACRDQDIGANQVNQAIHQLDTVIQPNASAAEDMSATTQALSRQAQRLQASIAFFRIGESDCGATDAPPRANAPHHCPDRRSVEVYQHRGTHDRRQQQRPVTAHEGDCLQH